MSRFTRSLHTISRTDTPCRRTIANAKILAAAGRSAARFINRRGQNASPPPSPKRDSVISDAMRISEHAAPDPHQNRNAERELTVPDPPWSCA